MLEICRHIFGAYAREILEEGNFNEYEHLLPAFNAVQLNYNFKYRQDKWNILFYLEFSKLVRKYKERIILQYNKSNALFVEKFKAYPEVDILFDASGGRGSKIRNIIEPKWDNYTGCAGGIGEDDIEKVALKLCKIQSQKRCWIDLESGARTNNKFDIYKVERILENVSSYIDY